MPELEATSLEGLAEGVYDVSLGSDSVNTLFAEDYRKENFLQQVDNMNILYVAMTRPALGVHLISALPPAKCIQAVEEGKMPEFKNFSQILYWFLSSDKSVGAVRTDDEESFRFDLDNIMDFNKFRKSENDGLQDFEMAPGNEYPSIALNIGDGDPQADVRERGRLKYTADSIDFFSEEGEAGISASNRIKGVVLHDILSRIIVAEDLENTSMSIHECAKKNQENADKIRKQTRGKCVYVPQSEEERIIREFYGLPEAAPKVKSEQEQPKAATLDLFSFF
jgi:hypothetical protein